MLHLNRNNHSYTYDKNQNRSQDSQHGTTTTYSIASDSNRLLSSTVNQTTTNYEYDNAGNMIKDKLATYSYDGLNRLSKVTAADQTIATYQYNALSQRIVKQTKDKQYIFIYNSAGQLLEEINKTQNVIKDYVYADNQLVAIMENGQNLYIITDHLNAPQQIYNRSKTQQ